MSTAERAYRLLLWAYPRAFRSAYGREMALLFRDLRREAGARGVRFWAEMVWDVARSAPALRLETVRGRAITNTRTGEGEMMTMAILAILIGAVEAMNSLTEVWVRGTLGHGLSFLAGTVGTVAGVLLLASGVALLRRSPGAASLARGAAVTCLAVFVLIGVVQPVMSSFATILGIGYPIALLLFLRWNGERGMRAEAEVA